MKNKQEVYKLIEDMTGIVMPEDMSPNFNYIQNSEGFRFSASGLEKDFMHSESGELLFRGKDNHTWKDDWRIWKVVKFPYGILKYRLCKAMEGSGYEAFLVGEFTENFDQEERMLDSAKTLCNL